MLVKANSKAYVWAGCAGAFFLGLIWYVYTASCPSYVWTADVLNHRPQATTTNVSYRLVRYEPSDFERLWQDRVNIWGKRVCEIQSKQAAENKGWVDEVGALMGGNRASLTAIPKRLSRFVYEVTTSNHTVEVTEYIEPLAGLGRHPLFCSGEGTLQAADMRWKYVADVDHLLIANNESVATKTSHRRILFDVGASTWDTGYGRASQSWFYDIYMQRGIRFDRYLLWEATNHTAEEIFKDVPTDVMHSYQYFNHAVNDKVGDKFNPWTMLLAIAREEDFVTVKLDIDVHDVEKTLVGQLLANPVLFRLVDEFFWEHHIGVAEMETWYGAGKYRDTLADTYRYFTELRTRGIRAHIWV